MSKHSVISVVIPVYNEEKYLPICLSSLQQQTYSPLEIIVVDDGSTDKSIQIAKRYQVKMYKQKHQGPGAARNVGVAKSSGSIIVFADADMRYDKKYVEKLTQPIREGKTIGTFNKEEYVANPENIWSKCWNINSGLPNNRRLPVDNPTTQGVFRAIKKEYFIKGKGFATNEGYTDDGSLSEKIHKSAIHAEGAICYHYNPSSLPEVYYSARWIGRAVIFQPTIINFLRYSPVNSLRVALKYVKKGAPMAIIPFKIIYDAGMFAGIFMKNGTTAK